MPLVKKSLGPFTGVIDTANPALDLSGKAKAMKGFDLIGAGRLVTRSGTATVLTFKDDQGSPADVTSVVGIWQFKDKAVAIAHSTGQTDCYLYVLTSELDDWYDTAGALQGTTSPEPVDVIWSGITTAPDVFVAEGLGEILIAHSVGVDSSALNFATQQWDGTFPVALTTLQGNLDGGGAADVYFNGVVSFQNHWWGWGFGGGNTATTGYDPSKARFSAINFGSFSAADSITIGNRVKSDRERIINGGLAGNSLILQGSYITTRVTGYGRSSWVREVVDESSGITGPKAGVSDGGYWYYWSHGVGPQRIAAGGPPEDLSGGVKSLVASVVNPEKIVAFRETDKDIVGWLVDTGSGVRTRVALHTPSGAWLSTDDDIGTVMRFAGEVTPIVQSTAAGVAPPAGAPTVAVTSDIGSTTAKASWTTGDATATTRVEIRVQGATTWTVVTTVPAGTSTYTFSSLTASTDYEWRVAHYKGGQLSSYLGPSVDTQFTTSAGGAGGLTSPSNLALEEVSLNTIYATWTNSGEASVETEVYLAADSGGSAGTYSLKSTVATGVSSTTVTTPSSGGTWWVRIRHVRGADTSAYASEVSVTLT